MTDLTLWYEQTATEWTEALPIGNGRLGAMVFGGVAREHLQLNESTLWSGGPYSPVNPEALPHLAEVRELIFAGRYAEAEALANKHSMARPHLEMSYQPAGDLWFDFGHVGEVAEYRRSLDLDSAVAEVTYRQGGAKFRRETFVSPIDDLLVMRLSADRPGAISFVLSLDSRQVGEVEIIGDRALRFIGVNRDEHGIAGALRFVVEASVVLAGGTVTSTNGTVDVSGADEVLVLVDVATSFRRYDDVSGDPIAAIVTRLSTSMRRPYMQLLAEHVAEHRRLFRRLSVNLGASDFEGLPTDARLARGDAKSDPGLAVLYLQFGRYLMISSSRPGTQPATLQGIWNKETSPPWGSKYTANINLQMNYWLPDPANLGECMLPLIEMAEELSVTGAAMAKAHYGARGWVMHHNTDLWRATGPVDGAKWGLWPTGGAWVCAQLWDHVAFADDDALVARLYPVIRGAAEFMLDVLVPLPGSDYLVTAPSLSPENVHPRGAALCAGPTMDNQIIRDLFAAAIEASVQLGLDADFRAELNAARRRLPPDRVGEAGQLQEWLEDWDLEVPEVHHRHVSHLYGLYPSQQIDIEWTPELAAAAKRSLDIRGDDATGWGIGWRVNLWARLRDGEHAHAVLARLLGPERTYPNMFDAHPPFQIDGNFGGSAGILEMLVQSRGRTIHLLPALPKAWPTGSLSGVCVRGGISLDLRWRDGKLERATAFADDDKVVMLVYAGLKRQVAIKGEEPLVIVDW